MCLNIHWWNRRPHVAKKDIVVYKMIVKDHWNSASKGFVTPHQFATVTIGETYTSELQKIYSKWNKQWTIEQGLHSLVKLSTAKKLATSEGYHLAKCIIPKGSMYYRGKWQTNEMGYVRGYASSAIKYVELINK